MAIDVSQLSRPGVDPAIARSTQRAQDLTLAQLAGSQPAGPNAPTPKSQDVAQAAAGTTSQVGQQVLKQAAGEVAALKGETGVAMAGEAATAQKQLGQAKLTRQQQAMQNEAQLASLSASVKKKELDDKMQFANDVNGQKVMTTSQLTDWAIRKSKSQQDLLQYQQTVNEGMQKEEATAKAGYDAMTATLEAITKGQIQGMDEQTKLAIAKAQAQFKLQYEQSLAKKQATAQAFQAGGTIIGGVAGAFVGGPAGAMVGAAAGGAVGSMAGSQMTQ